ncbi:MAG: ABC transporter ATP-binding protein [Acidobacteriota bacterium]
MKPRVELGRVELRGLTKTYSDGTTALQPLHLDIEKGVLGVLGPNGAGKSTLLSMIVLALEPTDGKREYFGLDDRSGNRARIRSWIGFLPQELEIIPRVTGLELLTLTGQLRELPLSWREIQERARRLLEAVQLEDAAGRPASTYSGGMLRRLGLAQALMHSPRLLVVDEPTAGLDPEERIRFRSIVTEIGDRIPVLVSTHIVEDIEATSSRLCIIEGGRKVFDGPPKNLFEQAAGRVWRLPNDVAPDGQIIGYRGDDGKRSMPLVLGVSRPHQNAHSVEPTLEEAYAVFLADLGGQGTGSAT